MSQPPPGGPIDKTPATLPFQPAEVPGVADTESFAHDTSAPDEKAAENHAAAGQHFGDYELLEEIARGGMGVVYKARQRGLKRLVALKTIQAGEFANADQILRFQTEAQSVARLNHPGIVPVYEVGIYRGLHFFSMQYLAGGSLADRLKDGPLPPRDGAAIVRQVAEAVQAAHEQQIIHRDLKPGNILLDEQGVPRVTDFGLAKQLDSDDGLTQTGDVMGTPSYMAPEQAQGQQDRIGPATDVYALGAILYHVLTGRPPFQGASKIETLRQVVEQEPVPLRQLNAAIPRDLETITLKCLRKEQGKRYTTAEDLAADVGLWLQNKPILARPVGHGEKVWLWCKRRPTVAAAIALIAVTMIGSGMAIIAIRNAAATRQAETESMADRVQAKTEEKAAREQAEILVESHLIAPAAAVQYTLQQLKPLQQYATPLLQTKLADESTDAGQRLHAAYGLTELGIPQQALLLDAIPTAPDDECQNLVAALQGLKSSALPELAERSAKAAEPLVKFRYAIVALQLGDPQPAQERLALGPDPIDRTTFIHALASWHGDLTVVADLLSKHEDSAFRSGLCAALGMIRWEEIPDADHNVVSRTLADLYAQAPDGGTHSAAEWALRQWRQEVPQITRTFNPPAGRGWYLNRWGQTMIAVPAGRFTMGLGNPGELPLDVAITRGFWLEDREVTIEQYRDYLNDDTYPAAEKAADPERPRSLREAQSQDLPLQAVSWLDAVLYCNWLSAKERIRPTYERTGEKWRWKDYKAQDHEADAWRCDFKAPGYRLPTEAEWEYACRALTASAFAFGDEEEIATHYDWFASNSKLTARLGGMKLPNAWGLFDMHGNLEEWCHDSWSNYPETESTVIKDPVGPDTPDRSYRVKRGGAFYREASSAHSAHRFLDHPNIRSVAHGFRVVRIYPLDADEAGHAVVDAGSASAASPPMSVARAVESTRAETPASDHPEGLSLDKVVQLWVEEHNGNVKMTNGLVTDVQIVAEPIADADLACLGPLSELRYLNLGRTPITDAGIAHLCGAKKLETLLINGTRVTGPGLADLAELLSLRILSLEGSLIDDDSLSHLPSLRTLRNLLLVDTKVTDAGLTHLASLPELRVLNLTGSPITDAGIEQLSGLADGRLEKLYLEGTSVTPAGAVRLRAALPKCRIEYP